MLNVEKVQENRAGALGRSSKRMSKAKAGLTKALNKTTSKVEAQRIVEAVNELFWANHYHFLTYVSAV